MAHPIFRALSMRQNWLVAHVSHAARAREYRNWNMRALSRWHAEQARWAFMEWISAKDWKAWSPRIPGYRSGGASGIPNDPNDALRQDMEARRD